MDLENIGMHLLSKNKSKGSIFITGLKEMLEIDKYKYNSGCTKA